MHVVIAFVIVIGVVIVTAAAGRSSAFGHCIAACHGDCTVRDRYFAGVAIDSPAAGRVAGAGSLRIPALRKESDVIDLVAVSGSTYNISTCAAPNIFSATAAVSADRRNMAVRNVGFQTIVIANTEAETAAGVVGSGVVHTSTGRRKRRPGHVEDICRQAGSAVG